MKPLSMPARSKAMIVAGVMSGTSADGVDVALVRITSARNHGIRPLIKLLGHRSFAYQPAIRKRVLAAMDARSISVAELARLNWRLGEIYSDCVAHACSDLHVATLPAGRAARARLGLVGLHGQTLFHQAVAAAYAGAPVTATWQTGEPAVLRERLGVPVISDFRPADLAAGGQGAPLVPMLDYCFFHSATKHRVLLNLGGIANVTAIPADASLDGILAFDTGPANMVVDALMSRLFGKRFDRDGTVAARGRPVERVIERLAREPYFSSPPPKSCGREQFGNAFAERLLRLCASSGASKPDIIASAAELTVRTIVAAFDNFCRPLFHTSHAATELIVAGGGARNAFLVRRLREEFEHRRVKLLLADELGIPAEAKEAVAFALLAWLSWNGLPGNVPAATGAKRSAVLGRVTC